MRRSKMDQSQHNKSIKIRTSPNYWEKEVYTIYNFDVHMNLEDILSDMGFQTHLSIHVSVFYEYLNTVCPISAVPR